MYFNIQIGPDNAEKSTFVQQDAAIPETDFLPAKAQTMCEGHNVYWATEQCDGEQEVGKSTLKHGMFEFSFPEYNLYSKTQWGANNISIG